MLRCAGYLLRSSEAQLAWSWHLPIDTRSLAGQNGPASGSSRRPSSRAPSRLLQGNQRWNVQGQRIPHQSTPRIQALRCLLQATVIHSA